MTDERKPLEGLDWDSVLGDWDRTADPGAVSPNTPESAQEVQAQAVGAPAPRPLYRPPPRPAAGQPSGPVSSVVPTASGLPPVQVMHDLLSDLSDDDEGGATIIAAVPHELLVGAGRDEESAKSHGGGLGQLFARGETRPDDGPLVEEPTKATRRPPPPIDEPSVITSAQHLMVRPPVDFEAPLRRPSHVDPMERVDEEGFYDPFADLTAPPPLPKLKPPVIPLHSPAAGRPPTPVPPRPPPPSPPPAAAARPGETDQRPTYRPPREALEALESGSIEAADALLSKLSSPPVPRNLPAIEPPKPSNGGLAEVSLADALLQPDERMYDPNDETRVRLRSQPPPLKAPSVAPRPEPVEVEPEEVAAEPDDDVPTEEKPASAWLTEPARLAMLDRGAWLEAEARTAASPAAKARGLLVASELRALAGDREGAKMLAVEARDTAPTMLLAHKQARALSADADIAERVRALDTEAEHAPDAASRAHASLAAAAALHHAGDEEGAEARYARAVEVAPSDVRAPLIRAARALARGDVSSVASLVPSAPEQARVSLAFAAALRLRGASTEGLDARPLPNDAVRRARAAVDTGDIASAAAAVAELREVRELSSGALWLAAALGATRGASRAKAAQWLRTLAQEKGGGARRALAARGLELGLGTLVEEALDGDDVFSASERAVLARLAGLDSAVHALRTLGNGPEIAPLAAAMAAATLPVGDRGTRERDAAERAACAAGDEETRATVRVARLIATQGHARDLEDAVLACGDSPMMRALGLELAVRAGRHDEVSDALRNWVPEVEGAGAHDAALAAAFVAERARDRQRAVEGYRAALTAVGSAEGALRAVAALDPSHDLTAGLFQLADGVGEGVRGAILRLEAVAHAEAIDTITGQRGTILDDVRCAEQLERAYHAAPSLPIAPFFAERLARRNGDHEAVLRWVRERRASASDPLEAGMDAVREAFLMAGTDREQAAARLDEAHRARPDDVALRDLFERTANEPPAQRAAWRERRAGSAEGEARALLFLEAAYEYERVGDKSGALRSAEAAASAAGGEGLTRVARERAELESAQIARLADELLTIAKETGDPDERREAYERLSILDGVGREDAASATLWHRSILEESPLYPPSLRHIEHALISEGRDEELEPIASSIAKVLAGPEASAHAELAARLRMREGDWDGTRPLVELAAMQPDPSLWSLRMRHAHARAARDDAAFLSATVELAGRLTRSSELASLLVRGGEVAARLGDLESARELLERAAQEDAADVVTWGLLADVRQRMGDARGAAEACESLARTSVVAEHRLLAWYDAGRIWLDDAKDADRAVVALEHAAAIDVTFQDTFGRLSALYTERKAQNELASLLERRIAKVSDPSDRVAMEVERGKALLEVGDLAGARTAFRAALALRPDDPTALGLYADLSAKERDWEAAEQSWVRLACLLPDAEDQRAVYARLGELYGTHAPNLSRAEVAYREVLKRAPNDVATMEHLVDVYRRLGDAVHAVELQQELLTRATSPDDRRRRLVDMANLWETVARDQRKAEQALEAARREAPTDVRVLRALVEFYQRHRQLPAISILLDRTAADVRRAFAAGRFAPALFEVLEATFDLRGRKEAARVVAATHAAFEGRPAEIRGADSRAFDPRLDELLAPEGLSAAFRMLLAKTGDALDHAVPVDARSLDATTMPPVAGTISEMIAHLGTAAGLGPVRVYVSPKLGRTCIPLASSPPSVAIGDGLLSHPNEPARAFLVARALKLTQARAASLVRTAPADLAPLVSAWLQAFNPQWTPDGVDPQALAEAARRLHPFLPRAREPEVAMMALEIVGSLGGHLEGLGTSALLWANRAALLTVGSPSAALDGIAMSLGATHGAPADPEERAAWIARTPEARDVVAFGVSDAYGEMRAQMGLER